MSARQRDRDEGGFSLIELAVAISVLGLVMGGLVGVFVTLLELAPTTGSIFSESHDAQLAASYWVTDVESADNVSTGARACPTSPAGSTPLVSFQWPSAGGAGAEDLAVYQRRPVAVAVPGAVAGPGAGAAAQEDLIRTFCVIRDGVVVTAPTSTVIAHRVQPVQVSCNTLACTPPVATSKLTVTEASGYTFTVAGTRRSAPGATP